MIEVKFTTANAAELQEMLNRVANMMSGIQSLGEAVNTQDSLALYSDEELIVEIARRAPGQGLVMAQASQPKDQIDLEPVKGKPGRKPKLQAVAPPPPEPQPANEAANEPAPQPEAVAKAKPVEPSADNPIAPETLTEADMLKLMQELYAESGDLTMVRGLAEEVCGKPQMSEVRPELYPQLKKRIEEELARVRSDKKAAGVA